MYNSFAQKQFGAMLDALMNNQYSPTVGMARQFKDARIGVAVKALQCRNLFVAATGHYLTASPNATFTAFTPALGFSVIVFGCSISDDLKPVDGDLSIIRGEIRVRPPVPLSINYIQPQKAFAPGTYSIYFPCPFILKAGDQIATDFGFNAPESGDTAVDTDEQQIVFFCIQVKDCLDSEDDHIIEQIKREVEGRDYQQKLLVPCTNSSLGPGGQDVIEVLAGQNDAVTRAISATTLVTGYSIVNQGTIVDGNGVRLSLSDTATQHSFTLGKLVKGPNLFWAYSPSEPGRLADPGEPATLGPYYSYFKFPVPHLLRAGASLACSAVGGLTGPAVPHESFALMFELLTV